MAKIECAICGNGVVTTAKNYIYSNGLHQHVKCPRTAPKLSKEEKEDMKKLTDAIKWAGVKYEKPLNWSLITAQIKELKELGYSYADQLYALKYIVEKDGTFWGYGRTKKFIDHALEHKQKLDKYQQQKIKNEEKEKKVEFKVKSKSSFLDF